MWGAHRNEAARSAAARAAEPYTPGKAALLGRLRLVQEERERLLHKAADRLAARRQAQHAEPAPHL